MPGKSVLRLVGRVAGIGILLLVACIAVYVFLTFRSIYNPKPFDQKRFDAIVAAVRSGGLKPTGAVVVLPAGLAEASVTGRAYITKGILLVPTWVGRMNVVQQPCGAGDDYVHGYIYSLKPLAIGSYHLTSLNAPKPSDPSKAAKDAGVWSNDFFIRSRAGDHWYLVDSFSGTCL
jgi:hypothetical protein